MVVLAPGLAVGLFEETIFTRVEADAEDHASPADGVVNSVNQGLHVVSSMRAALF